MKKLLLLFVFCASAVMSFGQRIPPQQLREDASIRKFTQVADVATATGLRDGERVQFAGDPGLFVYDASASDTVNATATAPGTVVNGPGGIGRLLRLYQGSVYPEWWGAVGDGVADDTTAIQTAVNLFKGVRLTGRYLVTSTLMKTGELRLEGEGRLVSEVIPTLSVTGGNLILDNRIESSFEQGTLISVDEPYNWMIIKEPILKRLTERVKWTVGDDCIALAQVSEWPFNNRDAVISMDNSLVYLDGAQADIGGKTIAVDTRNYAVENGDESVVEYVTHSEDMSKVEAAFLRSYTPQATELKDETRWGSQRIQFPGYARQFDGVDDIIDCGQPLIPLTLGNGYSISFWCYIDSAGITYPIGQYSTSANPDRALIFASGTLNGSVGLWIGGTNVAVANVSPGTGVWYHICVTVDANGDAATYLNGSSVATGTGAGGWESVNTKIGNVGGTPFPGKLFDVRIFNRALNAAEVAKTMTPQSVAVNNMIAWYRLDETSSDTTGKGFPFVWDSSGQGNTIETTYDATWPSNYADSSVPYSFANEIGFGRTSATVGPVTTIPNTAWAPGSGDTGVVIDSTGIEVTVHATNVENFIASPSINFQANTNYTIEFDVVKNTLGADFLLRPVSGSTVASGYGYISFTPGTTQNFGVPPGFVGHVKMIFRSNAATSLSGYVNPSGTYTGQVVKIANYTVREGIDPDDDMYPYIPRNEAVPTKTVEGGDIEFVGPVPRNAKLKQSNCLSFDGVDDIVGFDKRVSPSGKTSLSAGVWMRSSASGTNGTIIGEYDANTGNNRSWKIQYWSTRGLEVNLYENGGTTNYKIHQYPSWTMGGEWHHIAFTFEADSVVLYVDGEVVQPEATLANSTINSVFDTSARTAIGGDLTSAGSPSNLAEQTDICGAFAVARKLTQAEIKAAMEGQYPSDCFVVCPLAEGAGTTAYNLADTSKHGTITSATWALQDVYHHNLRYGFHNVSGAKVPLLKNGLSANDNSVPSNPAGPWHNGAETLIDFAPEPNAPWLDKINFTPPSAFGFGDAVPSGMTKEVNSKKNKNFILRKP